MATIAGPRFQFSVSDVFDFQYDEQGKIVGATLKQETVAFLSAVQNTLYAGTRSGPTSSRPTSSMDGRYVGMPYLDTTLGKPIWLKTASTNVWIDATGSSV